MTGFPIFHQLLHSTPPPLHRLAHLQAGHEHPHSSPPPPSHTSPPPSPPPAATPPPPPAPPPLLLTPASPSCLLRRLRHLLGPPLPNPRPLCSDFLDQPSESAAVQTITGSSSFSIICPTFPFPRLKHWGHQWREECCSPPSSSRASPSAQQPPQPPSCQYKSLQHPFKALPPSSQQPDRLLHP